MSPGYMECADPCNAVVDAHKKQMLCVGVQLGSLVCYPAPCQINVERFTVFFSFLFVGVHYRAKHW